MIYYFILILVVYVSSIWSLIYGFDKVETKQKQGLVPTTKFSVIVPFRNEESDFLNLLNSFSTLNYPKNLFEIIAVNDDSDDDSVQIFSKWQRENPTIPAQLLQNVRTSNAPKKDAISTAISRIKNDWIMTTDADCVVNANWLLAFDHAIQNSNSEMLVGAVSIKETQGFLNYFQFVDLLSLQGTTIGSFGINKPFMCNGANFAYTKNLFLALNGFEGNNKIASGDDVFLLQKAIKKCPKKVEYLKNKEAIVFTKSENSWSKLFSQRVRWASKTASYDGFFGKFLATVVFAMNLNLIVSFIFLPFVFCVLLFLVKVSIDLILLYKTKKFIGSKKFSIPVLSSIFYPIFCVSVATYSLFGKFEWKNRSFNA